VQWKIKHIFNYNSEKAWGNGFCHGGFHDKAGRLYHQEYFKHWIGVLGSGDKFLWTAGLVDPSVSKTHIPVDLKNPHYITTSPHDGSTLVSSGGTNKIYKIFAEKKSVKLFIDTERMGLKDIGNCEYDLDGNIWVNEITGCRVWQFDSEGKVKQVIGDGTPGFQKEPTGFAKARFNWIYDLRLGPDGNIYVLDSKNYAVRMIDLQNKIVTLVAGTGQPGYTGDGGNALNATLGSDPNEKFDGPYSLSLDEDGNIYIGDTQNHVLRMVEKKTNIISTIAGNHQSKPHVKNDPQETDPLKLNLPKICSLDYFNNCLFIPEWDGDMIILEKIE
jgi:DNA-binding beta-propeller fold protein YncE